MEHSIWTHVLIFTFYLAGQVLHTLSKAVAASRASGVTLRDYFRERGFQVAGRKFIGLCAFLIIWDNPALVGLSEFVTKVGLYSIAGAAGVLGWFSDSVAEKFQKKAGLSDNGDGNGKE